MRSPRFSSPATSIGQKIRSIRLQRRLTQTDLARQIGIQQSDLSRMEKGEYRVSLDVLFRILHALELSLGDFFGDLATGDLTEKESHLLHSFRLLPPEVQDEIVDFVDFKRDRG